MNDVILTTVKAGTPDLDVPGQGHARRHVGEMTIAGATPTGARQSTPDRRSRAAPTIGETARGPGHRTMAGNDGRYHRNARAGIDTDRPRHRLPALHLPIPGLPGHHMTRPRDLHLDLRRLVRETLTVGGGSVQYL